MHLTVNGMGERAGNAPMASVAAVIKDFLPEIKINLKEKSLYKVSKLFRPLQVSEFLLINPLSEIMYLPKPLEFMQTEITKRIYITMTFYQKGLVEKEKVCIRKDIRKSKYKKEFTRPWPYIK